MIVSITAILGWCKILCTKENISLRILSVSPPWVCVCGLRRFSERPDRASKNKASSGEASWSGHTWTEWDARAGLALPWSWGQCQPQAISFWRTMPGWWNYEVPGTHIKRNLSSPEPVGSPPQTCGYFFSYYLCYKKGTFSVQGLPTATPVWHKSASSAFSSACDLQLKPKYPCLGREASRNYAPTHTHIHTSSHKSPLVNISDIRECS